MDPSYILHIPRATGGDFPTHEKVAWLKIPAQVFSHSQLLALTIICGHDMSPTLEVTTRLTPRPWVLAEGQDPPALVAWAQEGPDLRLWGRNKKTVIGHEASHHVTSLKCLAVGLLQNRL